MKNPTSIAGFRRWLSEQFHVFESLAELGEPDFFTELDVAEVVEQAKRLACRFGAGDLIADELPMATPREGLAILGRFLAWAEQSETPELLTVEEVAAKMGTSARTVWRMLSSGQIPEPVKVRGSTKWRSAEIQATIELFPKIER